MTDRELFLAGERPDDVHIYLDDEIVSNADALASHAERVADGLVLILSGDRGRSVFETATGIDPMALARTAMETDGTVDPDCAGGACPVDPDHDARLVFAFVEAQNTDVGGMYAEGPVVHAYAACACGERYSDKWVAGERSDRRPDKRS